MQQLTQFLLFVSLAVLITAVLTPTLYGITLAFIKLKDIITKAFKE